MNAEGGSLAPGGGVAVAAAGPVVAGAGSSMSAEFGTTGVGFDGGSPTFSGLGRSDFSSGQFSVNEGPKGPVSFTNSIDLFAETKPITSPTFSVPEGPVRGDIFGQTEIIAKAPVAASTAEQETKQAIFGEIQAPTPEFEARLDQSNIIVEAALESYLETSDTESSEVTAETLTQAVENLKVNDPLVYAQLKSDLESVDVILDLVDQVGADAQTSANISNSAIETAVKRSGLIQESEADQEPDAEASDRTDNQQTEIDEEIETDETPPVPQDNKDQGIVRHEEANEARVEHRNEALRQAAQEDVDPVTGKLKGKAILERVNTHDNEQSDLAQSAGVEDGSIPEADRLIARSEFKSIEEAEKVIFNAVKENTGVKRGTAGQGATQEEVRKVLKGKPTANTIEQSLPKAA